MTFGSQNYREITFYQKDNHGILFTIVPAERAITPYHALIRMLALILWFQNIIVRAIICISGRFCHMWYSCTIDSGDKFRQRISEIWKDDMNVPCFNLIMMGKNLLAYNVLIYDIKMCKSGIGNRSVVFCH